MMNPLVLQFSLIFLVVGGVLIAVVKKLKNVLSANGKKGILYLIAVVLVFALGGALTAESLFEGNLMANYISLMVFFLLMGCLHLFVMEVLLQWEEGEKEFSQFLFTLIGILFGCIGFLQAAAYVGLPGFYGNFMAAVLLFLLPTLFRQLWHMLIYFPLPVFIKWYYPIARSVVLPDSDELRDLRILSLEFEKTPHAARSIFKVKAPANMNFGKFFYHFINDYNYRTPEAPIAYKDASNQVYGWSFSLKPSLLGISRSINPELTVNNNGLKEHYTIVCRRV